MGRAARVYGNWAYQGTVTSDLPTASIALLTEADNSFVESTPSRQVKVFDERHRLFLLVLAAHIVLTAAGPGMMSYSVTLANRILEDIPG